MARQVRSERLLLGLHGLALLRGWPLGDDATADEHIEAIRRILRDEPTPLDVTDVGAAEGYAAWSEHYDGWNPLIEAEGPAVRRFLQETPPGRALDLACGTGRVASLLVDLGHRVRGHRGLPSVPPPRWLPPRSSGRTSTASPSRPSRSTWSRATSL